MYMYILSHFVMRGASDNRCPFPGRKIWPCVVEVKCLLMYMYMYMYILSHFVMRGASNNRCPFPGRKIWPCVVEVKCLLTLGREREGELNKWDRYKMSQWYR